MIKFCSFFILSLLTLNAFAQSPCNEPILALNDSIGLSDEIKLVRNPGCTKDFTYVITKAVFTVGNGSQVWASEETNGGKIPTAVHNVVSKGSKISIKVLEAKRILNGQEQLIPIGGWGTGVRPAR